MLANQRRANFGRYRQSMGALKIAERAPGIHTPPSRPRKKRIRRAVAQPQLPTERQHQPATQPEKKTEPAS